MSLIFNSLFNFKVLRYGVSRLIYGENGIPNAAVYR
jgi:hypothetical protein